MLFAAAAFGILTGTIMTGNALEVLCSDLNPAGTYRSKNLVGVVFPSRRKRLEQLG